MNARPIASRTLIRGTSAMAVIASAPTAITSAPTRKAGATHVGSVSDSACMSAIVCGITSSRRGSACVTTNGGSARKASATGSTSTHSRRRKA